MDTAEELSLQKLIATISEYKATDLHLSVGVPPMLRIDGNLMPVADAPLVNIKFVNAIADAWLDEKQKAELAEKHEIVFAYAFKGRTRLKVTMTNQQGTVSISLKLIPDRVRPYEDLGFPSVIENIIKGKKGFLVIAGPYNSGRTSTLASILEDINQNEAKRVVTLEDPMEFLFADAKAVIEQREVGRDVASKEKGLENVMHDDVDVAVIHSLESAEAISQAVSVAASGRLVLASINSDGIVAALKKMINSFSQEERPQFSDNLADNLSGVIAQKIVPKIGGSSVLAAEIMIPNQPIRAMIKQGDLTQIPNAMQTARSEGMVTMDQKLAELVNAGVVQMEKALELASSEKDFRTFLNQT